MVASAARPKIRSFVASFLCAASSFCMSSSSKRSRPVILLFVWLTFLVVFISAFGAKLHQRL